MRLEQSVGTQLAQRGTHRHHADTDALRQFGLGGQAVTIAQDAEHDRLTDAPRDLVHGRRRVDRLEDGVAHEHGLVVPHGGVVLRHCAGTIGNLDVRKRMDERGRWRAAPTTGCVTRSLRPVELDQRLPGLYSLARLHVHRGDGTGM